MTKQLGGQLVRQAVFCFYMAWMRALNELAHRVGKPADGGDAQELLAVDLPGVGQLPVHCR